MALYQKDRELYRIDEKGGHQVINEDVKRRLIQTYLPDQPEETDVDSSETTAATTWKQHKAPAASPFGVRRAFKNKLYLFVFVLMHTVFSIYIRIRQAWHTVAYRLASILYYHHRTPAYIEKDVEGLRKMPKHLSVILRVDQAARHGTELERLVNETAEIAVWCTCAKIPRLTVYEKTGIMKRYLPHVQQAINQKFRAYFGRHQPSMTVSMPHADEILESPALGDFARANPRHLDVAFISAEDGRESMVDLTKTLTEMSQRAKLQPKDIGSDLIDAELSEGIMSEPDLLILFGPYVELDGYPPWPIRLTEIFCLEDNYEVGYQVFLRALRNFASAQFRKGK